MRFGETKRRLNSSFFNPLLLVALLSVLIVMQNVYYNHKPLGNDVESSTPFITQIATSTTAANNNSLERETIEDIVNKCFPKSAEEEEELKNEIKHYEKSSKFKAKIKETQGEAVLAAHHISIIKYLKENVLEEGWSVLDLGAAAGGMLQAVLTAYDEVPSLKGSRGRFQGIELTTGWVEFASKYFASKYDNVFFTAGDITDFTIDPPNQTFDFIMLNDVMEHLQKRRYGCFFKKLQSVTHDGSVVYMHTPTPTAQNVESGQYFELTLPHHIVITGMALAGFELVAFEHDVDTECGRSRDLKISPRQIKKAKCKMGGWAKYYHTTFVRTDSSKKEATFVLH
jgi:2-polyprenyl-3-methyl-5-hydroxy-6-metoxy-1,4-benzoquinol methylase